MEAQIYATDIVKTLVREGYIAYFAGGWVRDYLMGHPSEDIDIATNAPPEKILDLFPRTILVGLAFGVIIVVVDGHQFEVATFRRDIDYADGRKPSQIELATPEEDAFRRDFTINGMFYDPLQEVVHDFVQGTEDIKRHLICTIGNPYERFVEDRLRMIRAVRFAARFGFVIDADTQEAIRATADALFPAVAMERVWQEFCKMSSYPRFEAALIDMQRLGLLGVIFPALAGVHLTEIKRWVEPFAHYPKGVATIIYLLALFPDAGSQDALDLCRYLRTSAAAGNLAEFLVRLRQCVQRQQVTGEIDKAAWVHLYAHAEAERCIQVLAAHMADDEREIFLAAQRQLALALEAHIQRVVQKKPLVSAAILQAHGVVPGKSMGVILKEAERLVIVHDFKQADEAVAILKESGYF